MKTFIGIDVSLEIQRSVNRPGFPATVIRWHDLLRSRSGWPAWR